MQCNAELPELMSCNPWFASLPPVDQKMMLRESTLIHLAPGEWLFRKGDVPSGFHGLCTGRLKASTLREDGREAILVILEPGHWFGQTSMITGQPRNHDVTALESAEVLMIEAGAFDAMMRCNAFARAIASLEAMHTSLVFRMLEDATLYSTRARIARRLMRLSLGDTTTASVSQSKIPISQDTLAKMLGITRQTLSLELKAMVTAGAIALGYGRIDILSAEILKSFEDKI